MNKISRAFYALSLCTTASAVIAISTPASAATHTGAAAASHMELKDGNDTVVCYVHNNTPASSRPVATGCPDGTYKEQLFDADWNQIGGDRFVPVGDSNTGGMDDTGVLLRNPRTAEKYSQQQDTQSESLIVADLTDDLDENDDGTADTYNDRGDVIPFDSGSTSLTGADGDGNFRVSCQWSHFSKDDPIVYPDDEGASHIHMFFGNTAANASTTTGPKLVESGGGTCNGFALNRSAYWMPALMNEEDKAVVPKTIFIYYKTRVICKGGYKSREKSVGSDQYECVPNDFPNNASNLEYPVDPLWTPKEVSRMPQGLQLLGGPTPLTPDANIKQVFWSCGKNGDIYDPQDGSKGKYNRIPTKEQCGTYIEKDGDGVETTVHRPLNATIYFPQCWNPSMGMKYNDDLPASEQHVKRVEESENCPAGWVRLPQLGVLVYWDLEEVESTDGWRLDSDMGTAVPGSTLHSDWIGGWHTGTQTDWIESCLMGARNCTIGETGTQRKLKRAINDGTGNDNWIGPRTYTIPGM